MKSKISDTTPTRSRPPHRHKFRWTLAYLRSGTCRHFDSLEDAKAAAFTATVPVAIRPPIYELEH